MVVFSVSIVKRGAICCRCSCMGSVRVSSCRCRMFVSCVYHVVSSQCCVLHDLQFVIAGRG